MASDNVAFVHSGSGNLVTPKGRLVWPSLFTPSAMRGEDESKAKYQATILIPASADFTALKDAAKEAAADKFGSKLPKNLRSPFRETTDKENLAEYADEYPWYITARSKDHPGVVGPNGKTVDDPEQVYSGRWAKMSIQAFGYDTAGNKGVSFGLQNVQLLDHDDVFNVGGARVPAESEFAAVDGAGDEGGSAEELFG